MKKRRAHASFIRQLRDSLKSLKHMKPDAVHVFSVNASYGHYQIVIGPERANGKQHHERPVEINGEIHHLFVSPRSVRIHPTKHQMIRNMRDTVIMRDLSIHLVDPDGEGDHLARMANNAVHARECINLAGTEGQRIIEEGDHSRHLTMAAYRIAQQDILRALRERQERTEESMEE